MFINDYRPVEEEKKYFDVADGDHRIAIIKAEQAKSKNGADMIAINLKVDGANMPLLHFVVAGEFFDANMTRIFDCFKIPRGNFNFSQWTGKIGCAHFEHKDETFTGHDGQQHTFKKSKLIYFRNHEPSEQQKQTPEAVMNLVKETRGTVTGMPSDDQIIF